MAMVMMVMSMMVVPMLVMVLVFMKMPVFVAMLMVVMMIVFHKCHYFQSFTNSFVFKFLFAKIQTFSDKKPSPTMVIHFPTPFHFMINNQYFIIMV